MPLNKRGPKPGANERDTPIFEDKVLQIVRMREYTGATFNEIAQIVGGTRMGVWYQYRRWKDWALNELNRTKVNAS